MVWIVLFQPRCVLHQQKSLSNMVVVLLVLTVFVIVALVRGFFAERPTYGSSLEEYIVRNNPQHSGDVERLTVEYNMKVARGVL